MTEKLEYVARGVRLDTEVWAALEKLRAEFGSYNKGLRNRLVIETTIWPDGDRLPGKAMVTRGIRPLRVKGDGKR